MHVFNGTNDAIISYQIRLFKSTYGIYVILNMIFIDTKVSNIALYNVNVLLGKIKMKQEWLCIFYKKFQFFQI